MSIKDDFIYLNTTKKLLKNEINKVNNVLDDNSTFRSYPQELFNGYLDILNNGTDTLWSNLEKVSQIGTEAVLENVENAPMKIELSGNITQETTEGYNLFNPTEEWPDNYGVVSTFDGQNIIWNGTSSRNATKKVGNINMPVDTYTIVFEPISGTHIDSKHIWIDLMNGNTKVGGVNFTSKGSKAITLSEPADNIKLGFDVSDTFDNYKFRILIHSGIDEKPYEPYTGGHPSPSPDYPQQVKVVTGENVVSVSGKNLYDSSYRNTQGGIYGTKCTVTEEDGIFKLTAKDSDARIWEITSGGNLYSDYILILGKLYEFKEEYYTVSLSNPLFNKNYVTYYDKNGVSLGFSEKLSNIFTLSKKERAGAKYFTLRLGIPNSVAGETYKTTIQLEEGTTAAEYQAFSKADYPITLSAENHFKGEFRRGGAVSTTITTRLFSDDNYSMEAGKQYVFETNLDMTQFNFAINISTREFPTTAMFDTGWLSSNKYVFTCAMDGHLGVPIRKKDDSIITLEDIDGVWFKLYEPIVETEETLELCKINTYKDYFYKDSGKWYVHKEIEKIVLDENTSFVKDSLPTDAPRRFIRTYAGKIVTPENKETLGEAFANVGIVTAINTEFNTKSGVAIHPVGNIYINENVYNNIANTNVILYVPLISPVEEEITNATLIEQLEAIYKAKSIKDKTYVTQTNDELPFVLDVEAIKKYEVA